MANDETLNGIAYQRALVAIQLERDDPSYDDDIQMGASERLFNWLIEFEPEFYELPATEDLRHCLRSGGG